MYEIRVYLWLNWSVPPRVSVVITTYNRSRLLPRAIESAQNAGTDLEVIVVDDCSSDDTPEVCAQIPGIRYVRLNANRGLANARNVGIAESSSEFVSFLDDDDLRLPGSLDKQLHTISADERIALCYGQALIGDARRQLPTGEIYPLKCPHGDIFWDLLEDNFISMPAVLARKCIEFADNFRRSRAVQGRCDNDRRYYTGDAREWLYANSAQSGTDQARGLGRGRFCADRLLRFHRHASGLARHDAAL